MAATSWMRGAPCSRMRRSIAGCSAISPDMMRPGTSRGSSRPERGVGRHAGGVPMRCRTGQADQAIAGSASGREGRTGRGVRGAGRPPHSCPILLDSTLDWSIPQGSTHQIGRHSVEVVIVPDATAGGELIAEAIASLLSRKPDALLGVATGSTPLPIYRALAAKVASGACRPASRAPHLASWTSTSGCPRATRSRTAPWSCVQVVEPLGLSEASFMGPDGSAEDVQAACEAYDRALAEAGGVDLPAACSASGTDGHIGFSAPVLSLASRTRIKTLTEQTLGGQRALLRRRHRPGAAPRDHPGHRDHPWTPGTRSCWPPGEGKAEAVAESGWRGRSPRSRCRASALQLHPHATVAADEGRRVEAEAGGLLPRHGIGEAGVGAGAVAAVRCTRG
ncbi:Glucosamine-6-phosphate deaminase [Streptomyces microflavus]